MSKRVKCLSCNSILAFHRTGSLCCRCGVVSAEYNEDTDKVQVYHHPRDPIDFLPDSKQTQRKDNLVE